MIARLLSEDTEERKRTKSLRRRPIDAVSDHEEGCSTEIAAKVLNLYTLIEINLLLKKLVLSTNMC